jgi:hypothetical protein
MVSMHMLTLILRCPPCCCLRLLTDLHPQDLPVLWPRVIPCQEVLRLFSGTEPATAQEDEQWPLCILSSSEALLLPALCLLNRVSHLDVETCLCACLDENHIEFPSFCIPLFNRDLPAQRQLQILKALWALYRP